MRFDRKPERYLLLYPERGLELNPSAGAIAALLSGERTVTGIVDALCAQYATRPRDVIERDVLAFLASLEAHGSDRDRPVSGERPYTLIAELTYRCPLRCVYCSTPWTTPAIATRSTRANGSACSAKRRSWASCSCT